MSDPLRHPDLVELTQRMRQQLEAVLQAEQDAAAASRRRRRVLRDRLLEAEDRSEQATIVTHSGRTWRGSVTGVGADHVILDERLFVALAHCVALEFHR